MRAVQIVKIFSFAAMFALAIITLVLGLMLQNSEAPHSIGRVPFTLIRTICLGVWAFFASILLAISLYHAQSHPAFALGHMAAILIVLGFFATYLKFDPTALHVWGPLAVVLGIILSTGIRATYNDVDREVFPDCIGLFFDRPARPDPAQTTFRAHELGPYSLPRQLPSLAHDRV